MIEWDLACALFAEEGERGNGKHVLLCVECGEEDMTLRLLSWLSFFVCATQCQ